jgi:hypothetical protein
MPLPRRPKINIMRYKSYIGLLAIAALMASCSQDVIEGDAVYEGEVYATLPELLDGSVTRSALVYNYSEKKMHFAWDSGDKIGVFAINNDAARRQQIQYDLKKGAGTMAGSFDSYDTDVQADIKKNQSYLAFRPYSKVGNYAKLDVKYDEQTAKAYPKMKYFPFPENVNPDANAGKYNASEAAASAHLTDADYMVAPPVVASVDHHCAFEFKRIGAVVRFYLKSPKAMIYDGIQLVAKGKKFVLSGMLDAQKRVITPVTTSTAMFLNFSSPLDMSKPTSTSADYYYNGVGYIVSYMMIAPIDLRDAEDISIYLKGHDGSGTYYFKSQGELEKPNLTANMFYQWTSGDNNGDPAIVFDHISVQDWERDVIYSNGEGGTGTGTW